MPKSTDLIYAWNSTWGDKDFQNTGFPLSGKYKINYNPKTNRMDISLNEGYTEGFWGENIINCFAVLGENGAGKTNLMNFLAYTLKDIKNSLSPQDEFIIIFEDKSSEIEKILIFCTKKFKSVQVNSGDLKTQIIPIAEQKSDFLKKYEIAYFHNPLSRNDYQSEEKCKYDFSTGKLIHEHSKMTYEMHYDGLNKDKVSNYFDQEEFRIIEFLYGYVFDNRLQIPFPVPNVITVRIADGSYHKNYIIKEAQKIAVNKEEEPKLFTEISKMQQGINSFLVKVDLDWSAYAVINVILNCFKRIVIPDVVPYNAEKVKEYCQKFCNICNNFNSAEQMRIHTRYNLAKKILNEFRDSFPEYTEYLNKAGAFFDWLNSNQSKICQYQTGDGRGISFRVEEQTKDFASQLLKHYSCLNFEFPFLNFSFGVSTGEYCFLSTFSQLFSMVNKEQRITNVYNYSPLSEEITDVLLIFDEADLSLHPRWQRMYIKWITDFCKSLFVNISVKIVITTHSPILLSDFPSNSVLYLKKSDGKIKAIQDVADTFGSNVYTLFLNSFFLDQDGTMGAFAEGKINEAAGILLGHGDEFQEKREAVKATIDYIGEGPVKSKLQELYYDEMSQRQIYERPTDERRTDERQNSADNSSLKEAIEKLKKQKEDLELIITDLEKRL